MNAKTLSELLQSNRGAARSITYYEGERERRVVRYAELYERALGILHHLQQLGARPGDRLLLFLGEQRGLHRRVLGRAYSAASCRYRWPPGISDEHRHKLLRIAAQLGAPFLYTERRLLERIRNFADEHEQRPRYEQLAQRSLLTDDLLDITRAGRVHAVRARRTSPSSSTPRARPVRPKASCSRTPTCSPTCAARPARCVTPTRTSACRGCR